jgi:hypothetical protein
MVEVGSNHVGADQQNMGLIAIAAIKKGPTAGPPLSKAKFCGLLCGGGLAGEYFLGEKGARGETKE